jgi:RNA polymerase sigma-70 factor (ECF subfamily)
MNDQQQGLFHKKDLDFQAIYAEFQPRILRYVTNMVGDTDAEDLTQEIFIKVSQALPSFHGDSSLSTWLYRIATNAALDRLRSPAYRLSTQLIEQANPTDNLEPQVDDRNIWTGEKVPVLEWQVVRKEMSDCLQEYIQRLPESYRTVLALSEFEGLSNHQMADILQVTTGAVKIRLHRARERLKADLIANCPSYWVEGNEFLPDLRKL